MSPNGLKAEKHKTKGMGMQLLSWQELSYSFWTEGAKSPAPPDCFEFRPAEGFHALRPTRTAGMCLCCFKKWNLTSPAGQKQTCWK